MNANADDVAAHHIIWIWYQYAGKKKDDGSIYLEHQCMSAGEDAAEWLESRGYVIEDGWGCVLTQKGIEVMDCEEYEGL